MTGKAEDVNYALEWRMKEQRRNDAEERAREIGERNAGVTEGRDPQGLGERSE